MKLRGLRRFFLYFLALPKTLYVNARLCPKNLLKIPIVVSHRTKLGRLSGNVEFASNSVKPGLVRIGFGDIEHVDGRYNRTILSCAGTIIFRGKAKIGLGSVVYVNDAALLDIGENFKISTSSKILCNKSIRFGCNVLMSWDVLVMDSDQHQLLDKDQPIQMTRAIKIGRDVWIGCRTYIGKGVILANGIVIAANSVVTKSFFSEGILIGGNPAKIIREHVSWKE